MHRSSFKLVTLLKMFKVKLIHRYPAKCRKLAAPLLWGSQHIWISPTMLKLLHLCMTFRLGFLGTSSIFRLAKKKHFSREELTGMGSQEISLWSDMLSADIRSHSRYLQLFGNIGMPIESCQTGWVNKMITSISQPQASKHVSHKDQASGSNSNVDERRLLV